MARNRILIIFIVAALFAVAAFTIREALATSAVVQQVSDQAFQAARDADAARWVAMGEYYTAQKAPAKTEAELIGLNADAARWVALGQYYTAQQALEVERLLLSQDASAARWTGLGQYYAAQQALEAERLQRGRDADVARWVGLGEYYQKAK